MASDNNKPLKILQQENGVAKMVPIKYVHNEKDQNIELSWSTNDKTKTITLNQQNLKRIRR